MKINFKKTGKFLLNSVLFLSLSFSLTNCSKKNDPEPIAPLQDPLQGYLAATGFKEDVDFFINDDTYEFGYSFVPLVNGKMTAIVVKIPDINPALRVTIWDKTAAVVLRTEIINVANTGMEVTKQIAALDLIKNKEYFITFNSDDWYQRKRSDASAVTYPFTVGDIKVTSYAFNSGSTQSMPNTQAIDYYAGDCSFKFQK